MTVVMTNSSKKKKLDLLNNNKKTKGRSFYFVTKRIFDLIISIAALPIMLVCCIVILPINLIWNPGPLFYRQIRMGKDGRKFAMFKFRTMLPDQDEVKRGPFDKLEEWRITPFGRWMRLTRLDELPQILNVMIGQMSLIGPRPEALEFAQAYSREVPGYDIRGTVRPAMTGYAQVKQGYTDSEEAIIVKTELDRFYVENANWWLDLKVLFWTVRVLIKFHGAR